MSRALPNDAMRMVRRTDMDAKDWHDALIELRKTLTERIAKHGASRPDIASAADHKLNALSDLERSAKGFARDRLRKEGVIA